MLDELRKIQATFFFNGERVKWITNQLKVAVLVLFIFHVNFSECWCNYCVSVLDSVRAMGFGIWEFYMLLFFVFLHFSSKILWIISNIVHVSITCLVLTDLYHPVYCAVFVGATVKWIYKSITFCFIFKGVKATWIKWDLRFSKQWILRLQSSGLWHHLHFLFLYFISHCCQSVDYIASNGRMIGKWWIGEDFERSSYGLIKTLSSRFPGGTEENHTFSVWVAGVMAKVQTECLNMSFRVLLLQQPAQWPV